MTRTGDREIRSVSGKLPDNPGELARMDIYLRVNFECTSISVHFKGTLATNFEAFLFKL